MKISSIVYLSETIILALIILVGTVLILQTKKKKRVFGFLAICLAMSVAVLGSSFWFEQPEMKVEELYCLEVNSVEKISLPNTYYHFSDVTNNVKIYGDFDYNKVGEYDIKFEVETFAGTYSKSSKLKIIDTKSPVITLIGDEVLNLSYSKEFEEPGFEAIDENDGNITNKVSVTKEKIDDNNYNIKYEVQDESGNKTEKYRKVVLIDDVPPVITLNGNSSITLFVGDKYNESGAKAVDEKDGDLTEKIEIFGQVDTSKEGNYSITYKVKDSKENEAIAQRNVVVKKQEVIKRETTVTSSTSQATTTVSAQNGSNGKKGVIYLTFDDGPSTNITPKILDILKQKNVKATFFILNYNSAAESIVKREYEEGHTIAIHGYSHDYNTIYKSEEAYMQNITKLQEKIKSLTGYNATITRFPGGSSNTISRFNPGIMTRLCKLVVEKGYKYFDWNVSSGDAGGAKTADDVYNNVISGLSKSKANVVLMHDFSSNSKLLDALPRIIDYGLANGYTFERITESTPMVTHRPNN